jgi:hypothetical protein
MIRRDVTAADGSPAWMLISQIEHARVAAELAESWDAGHRPLIEPREEFIAAVRRHDDGWLVWETRPEVCDGRPRDFMEMPLDESLAIWRRSIAVAQTISPSAAVIVGGHFRFLCARTHEKHEDRHDWSANVEHLAEEFVAEQDELRREYLASVRPEQRAEADLAVERGLRLLQLFDYMSLWLCCAARTEPQTMTGPDGEAYVFSPQGGGRIAIDPWPFRPTIVFLLINGRRVAVGDYPSSEALEAAPSQEVELRLRLEPRRS